MPHETNEQQKVQPLFDTKLIKNALVSTTAGTVPHAFVFPIDKATHLAMTNNTNFLHKNNFSQPFRGFGPTMLQRAPNSGIFFFLQNTFQPLKNVGENQLNLPRELSNTLYGSTIGVCNALITSYPTQVRLYFMKSNGYTSFFSAAKYLWQHQKFGVFFNQGTLAYTLRDTIFGGIYELVRIKMRELGYNKTLSNFTGAATGTIVSMPFNYARSVIMATEPTQKAPSVFSTIKGLFFQNGRTLPLNSLKTITAKGMLFIAVMRCGYSFTLGQFMNDKLLELLNQNTNIDDSASNDHEVKHSDNENGFKPK